MLTSLPIQESASSTWVTRLEVHLVGVLDAEMAHDGFGVTMSMHLQNSDAAQMVGFRSTKTTCAESHAAHA